MTLSQLKLDFIVTQTILSSQGGNSHLLTMSMHTELRTLAMNQLSMIM
jgi:hypothetical protein